MPSELFLLTLIVLLVATLMNAVANWRLQSTLRLTAKLLASRTYTDYAVGEKTLARPSPVKPKTAPADQGYEDAWSTPETK